MANGWAPLSVVAAATSGADGSEHRDGGCATRSFSMMPQHTHWSRQPQLDARGGALSRSRAIGGGGRRPIGTAAAVAFTLLLLQKLLTDALQLVRQLLRRRHASP